MVSPDLVRKSDPVIKEGGYLVAGKQNAIRKEGVCCPTSPMSVLRPSLHHPKRGHSSGRVDRWIVEDSEPPRYSPYRLVGVRRNGRGKRSAAPGSVLKRNMDMGLPLTTGDFLWAGLIGVSVLKLPVNVYRKGGLPCTTPADDTRWAGLTGGLQGYSSYRVLGFAASRTQSGHP